MGLLTYRALVWRGAPESEERTGALVPPGYVLVKTVYAAWTGVEEYVRSGLAAATSGIIMGHTGVGRIVETGIGVKGVEAGWYAAVTSVYNTGFPGVDVDGFLAEYTVVEASALTLLGRARLLDALILPAALACDTVSTLWEAGVEHVAIYGFGVYAAMTWLLSQEKGLYTTVFTDSPLARRCRATVGGRPSSQWGLVQAVPLIARLDWRPRVIVAHPLAANAPRLGAGDTTIFHVAKGGGNYSSCARRLVEVYAEECNDSIRCVESLAEPPPLGGLHAYIYRLERGDGAR